MKNRFRYLAVIVCMVLFFCVGTKVSAAQMKGDGTSSNPYQVYTVENLMSINENPSAHYIQMADLEMKNIKVDTTIDSFSGVYNGNNKKIQNYCGKTLFGTNRGTIKNMVFVNPVITKWATIVYENQEGGLIYGCAIKNLNLKAPGGYGTVGGVVARNTGVVDACSVIGGRITGGALRGAIVGSSNGVGKRKIPEIKNCISNLSLDGGGITAGIVGETYRTKISNCKTSGKIAIKGAMVGGIVGSASGTDIMNCTSDVIFSGNGQTSVGGIVGTFRACDEGPIQKNKINNCKVQSNVTLKSLKANDIQVGGMIGTFEGYRNDGLAINNCYYEGTMNLLALNNIYAGGVIGKLNNGGSARVSITNCTTKGSINPFSGVNHSFTVLSGGIAGFGEDVKVESCNTNMVVKGNYAGGIFGQAEEDVSITNCLVVGPVDSMQESMGRAANYVGAVSGAFSGAKISKTYYDVKKTKQKNATGIKLKGSVSATGYETISFEKKTYVVGVNKGLTLKSILKPISLNKKKIFYKSSNTKVATVNGKGMVSAKKAGTTIITATIDEMISYKCTINVEDKLVKRTPAVKIKKKNKTDIMLSWTALPEADGYSIEKYDAKKKKYKEVKKVSAKNLSYTDRKLKKGTTYKYRVRAYEIKNRKKVYSKYKTVSQKL